MEAGAAIDAKDMNGDSPLTWASWHLRPDSILTKLCYNGFSIHPQRLVPGSAISPSRRTRGVHLDVAASSTASFTVAPTSDPVPRTASLAVADQTVKITQRAAPCRYRLSALQVSMPAPGGTGAVDVAASSGLCEWSVQSTADWVTISSGTSYKGNRRVTVSTPPWTGPERHSDVIVADQRVVAV